MADPLFFDARSSSRMLFSQARCRADCRDATQGTATIAQEGPGGGLRNQRRQGPRGACGTRHPRRDAGGVHDCALVEVAWLTGRFNPVSASPAPRDRGGGPAQGRCCSQAHEAVADPTPRAEDDETLAELHQGLTAELPQKPAEHQADPAQAGAIPRGSCRRLSRARRISAKRQRYYAPWRKPSGPGASSLRTPGRMA